jgi:GNAT superfamily N-acetyltransferase
MSRISFRNYRSADRQACLDIFDANCPAFFAPNERRDYEAFLDAAPAGYEVCESDGRLLGAFGLFEDGRHAQVINWILLAPQAQGAGVGSRIMERLVDRARRSGRKRVRIATSPMAAPFFERFGAVAKSLTSDGWGPGMDRLDMELLL